MKIFNESSEWFDKQASIIMDEILSDTGVHKYWHPKIDERHWPDGVPKHKTFEQAYMKFMNGNLNYYHFPNMVAHSQEQDGWNRMFPKTIDFCNKVRAITGNKGPFGRMCIWLLPPGKKLLPHVDDFEYHRHIIRNIFIVSRGLQYNTKIVIDGINAPTFAGGFFQFEPNSEKHEFINNSEKPFFFLGFDYWIEEKLDAALKKINLIEVINDPDRMKPIANTYVFGSMGTRCKYQSHHGLITNA